MIHITCRMITHSRMFSCGFFPPFVITKWLKMSYCYPAYGCIHALKQNGRFSCIEYSDKMWHSWAKTWWSTSTFMKKTILLYSLLHCECVLQVTNAPARCDSSWFLSWWTGMGKRMGGWPAIPKTYLQGIQTMKSHSYTSFLSALHFVAVVPSVLQSHLFAPCQSLLQHFFFEGSDFILLIHKIILQIKMFGKTSPKKKMWRKTIWSVLFWFLFCPLYLYVLALVTLTTGFSYLTFDWFVPALVFL